MDPIANNAFYVGAVQSTFKQTNTNVIPDPYKQNTYDVGEKAPSDVKSNVVTEKQDEHKNFESYNYRFQNGVAAAKLLATVPSYNEINNTTRTKKSSNDSKNSKYSDSTILRGRAGSNSAQGYYIVHTSNSTDLSTSQKQAIDPIKQQINKTYHLESQMETGMLVNIIYY